MPGGNPVQRLCRGSSAQLGSSKGFFLGGVKGPETDAVAKNTAPFLTQGLLVFDENAQSFKNVSTNELDVQGTVADGFLTSIESLGSRGM